MPSSRAEAWATLNEFTKSPHLIKHGLGVESAMRQYAPKGRAGSEAGGLAGLLHDLDSERHPEVGEHAIKGVAMGEGCSCVGGWCLWLLPHADYANAPRTTP